MEYVDVVDNEKLPYSFSINIISKDEETNYFFIILFSIHEEQINLALNYNTY